MIPPSNVELTRVHYYDENKTHRNLEISTISREVYQNTLNKNIIIKRNIFGHKWVLKINENFEEKKKNKCNPKVVVYVWVFCCIIVAIAFGIYLSIENKLLDRQVSNNKKLVPNTIIINDTNNSIILDSIQLLKDNISMETTAYMVETHSNNDHDDDLKKMTTEHVINDQTTKLTTEIYNNISNRNISKGTRALRNICKNCIDNEEICLKTEEFHSPLCVKMLDRRDPTGCGGLCELNVQHCRKLHQEVEVFQCFKNKNILHCPTDNFNCGNRCIEKNKRCDGVINCTDMTDEQECECNMDAYFHCGNRTSCIEKFKKCNGVIDCWDGSDEMDCNRDCNPDEVSCLNGDCIKKNQFCDGTIDCEDKTDEPEGC